MCDFCDGYALRINRVPGQDYRGLEETGSLEPGATPLAGEFTSLLVVEEVELFPLADGGAVGDQRGSAWLSAQTMRSLWFSDLAHGTVHSTASTRRAKVVRKVFAECTHYE